MNHDYTVSPVTYAILSKKAISTGTIAMRAMGCTRLVATNPNRAPKDGGVKVVRLDYMPVAATPPAAINPRLGMK